MPLLQAEPLTSLYEADETAWLDAMSDLVTEGRFAELDRVHLAEYLADMAKRDRREVNSRMAQLLARLLKWYFQPEKRTRNWERPIELRRQKLRRMLESGTLRNHVEDRLPEIYCDAVRLAVIDTGSAPELFPVVCPFDRRQIESEPLPRVAE